MTGIRRAGVGLQYVLDTKPHADYKVLLRFKHLLLRALLVQLDPIPLPLINAVQRVYVKLAAVYFQSLLEILDREKVSRDSRPRSHGTSQYRTLTMDYLRIVFKDTPEVIQLVECLTSVSAFEESLVPFPEPIVQERGGFFMRCCKLYELTCPLDAALFSVMTRLQKEDLYPLVVKKVHDNVAIIKFVLAIVVKAIEYHEEPDVILHKIDEVWKDLYNLCLNVLYQWLIMLDGHEMQRVFGALVQKFADFNEQLPQWLNQLREDLATGIAQDQRRVASSDLPQPSGGGSSGAPKKRPRNA